MNSLQSQTWIYAAVMLIAGIGIPIMAALNAGLGGKLQSTGQAAVILFAVGLITSMIYLLLFEGIPKSLPHRSIPFYFYLGGLFVFFFVISVAWVAPRFGVGNAVSVYLLGQLISMATIDHSGLFGATHYPMSAQRVIGLLFMAIGVFLVVRR